jgi:hypothetical protein
MQQIPVNDLIRLDRVPRHCLPSHSVLLTGHLHVLIPVQDSLDWPPQVVRWHCCCTMNEDAAGTATATARTAAAAAATVADGRTEAGCKERCQLLHSN